jgi:hypothetical protein
MKKLLFGIVATALLSISSFASTQIVGKQKLVTIENCKEKVKATYNLGNVTHLTASELNTLVNSLPTQSLNIADYDECSVTLTAEVSVGFSSVSVSVTYTASNCAAALSAARVALSNAVKEVARSVAAD